MRKENLLLGLVVFITVGQAYSLPQGSGLVRGNEDVDFYKRDTRSPLYALPLFWQTYNHQPSKVKFSRVRRIPYHYPGFWYNFLPKMGGTDYRKLRSVSWQKKRGNEAEAMDLTPVINTYQNGEPWTDIEDENKPNDYEYRKKLWEMYNIYNIYS
ncbi:uncharacterized protein LOC111714807 isoform X1 [Eurytemora carolleeae]|uniref:uncharacterized protein LOC111714807 isoform X1 n=1 Tax=Eurytemora carolleeae TaxID=1294199 RepID=UPI000C7563BF|nr:uncharacterized protein LOC111714807 isoform X1 [Eurytemora carolleeae]|eukprot:XP_023345776.1 uncharacterized protein LOC111714807 isoform X1 [Eurytemora affinis]